MEGILGLYIQVKCHTRGTFNPKMDLAPIHTVCRKRIVRHPHNVLHANVANTQTTQHNTTKK